MPDDPWSFLCLIVDDLRTHFGAYGHSTHGDAAVAPNMDRLARESLVFEHAYAQMAVCVPEQPSTTALALSHTHSILAQSAGGTVGGHSGGLVWGLRKLPQRGLYKRGLWLVCPLTRSPKSLPACCLMRAPCSSLGSAA